MQESILKNTVEKLLLLLSRGEYSTLIKRCADSRLTADDVRRAINEYGGKPVMPPDNGYGDLDAILIKNSSPSKWSVRIPIWMADEGRSDLTLDIAIIVSKERSEVILNDLHVP